MADDEMENNSIAITVDTETSSNAQKNDLVSELADAPLVSVSLITDPESKAGNRETQQPINCDQSSIALEETLAGLRNASEVVLQRIDLLQEAFDSKLRYDATKDKQFDALHEELRSYREDLYFKIISPLIMDLITEVYDDLYYLVRHEQNNGISEEVGKKEQSNLASFLDTIESILGRYGVSVFSDEGETFSPKRQRPIKFIETEIPEQDRCIAERLRKGFSYNGKILRPELVSIYRLKIAVKTSNSHGS